MMIALMMIMLCCVSQKTTAPKQGPFSGPNLAAKGEGAQYWPAPLANNTGQYHWPTMLL